MLAWQVYAFEPIPAIYNVLVRNLNNNSADIFKGGSCPKPITLRVALGAEQAEEEFHFFGDNPGESTRCERVWVGRRKTTPSSRKDDTRKMCDVSIR